MCPEISPKKQNIRDRIRTWFADEGPLDGKRDRSYLIWTFLIPFSFMLLLYALDGVFPFGDKSVLVLDLNAQYTGFFEALRAFVYGDGSMLYSFSRALGGEMMGIYAYYIASPLSYIVALFPAALMTEALLFIFILKTGLCGLTFGIYLDRHQYAKPVEAVMFSTLYALCSFSVVMQNNTMWMDSLFLLPLLTLGIERVIKYRRFGLYVVTLALSLLSNFYIGYMLCIYTLLYFLYYFYGYNRNRENNPLKEKRHYLYALLRMGVYSLLAIGMAAIILLTVLYSLSLGKNNFTDPSFVPYLQFDPLAFFTKLLPGVYDSVEPEGLPFVYCGVITLILVPLYFANSRFAKGERIASGVLLGVFYLSMTVSSLDMLWHGGQAPNWLNYRYSFILCFLLLVLAARAWCRIEDITPKQLAGTGVVLLSLLIVAATVGYEHLPLWTLGVAFVFLAVCLALCYAVKKYGKRFFSVLLLLVVLAETFYNGSMQIAGFHVNVGESNRAEYRDYMDRMAPLVEYLETYDTGFYRMETDTYRGGALNDALAFGYNGLTHSTSTLNEKTVRFLHRMGLMSKDQWSRYKGGTLTLDSLLGVKYYISTRNYAPSELYEMLPDAPVFIYENPYALPIAYAVNNRLTELNLADIYEPFERQNAMIGAMLGGDTADIYVAIKPDSETFEKVQVGHIEDTDGTVYTELISDYYTENAELVDSTPTDELVSPADTGMTWEVTVAQDGKLYFYIPTEYPSALTVLVDGLDGGTILGNETDHIRNLGYFEAGDKVKVSIRFTEGTMAFYYKSDATFFYQENTENAISYLDELSKHGMQVTEHSDTRLFGTVTTTNECSTVFTTIPYDAGWHVTVDGVAINTYETLDALLAFDLEPGEHTVEMVYCPASYVMGRTVSLISLAVFILLLVLDILLRKHVLRVKAGGVVDSVLSVFFNYETDKLPEEPNYLDDAYMPLPAKKAPPQDGSTDDAASPPEALGENEATVSNEAEGDDRGE